MGPNFREALSQDAAAIFDEDAEMTDAISYLSRAADPEDDPREIFGIINVIGKEVRPGMVHGHTTVIEIDVRNHATLGILSSEIDTGDTLTFSPDGTNEVTRVISTKDRAGKPLVTWDAMTVRITLI